LFLEFVYKEEKAGRAKIVPDFSHNFIPPEILHFSHGLQFVCPVNDRWPLRLPP
jgi:hypothetical protein